MQAIGQTGGAARGLGLVMAAAALWATVGVATQLLPLQQSISQDLLGVARMALGGPIILLVAALLGQTSLPAFRRLDPPQLAGFALGSMVFQVCLFRAFESLGVTATVFLTVCLPPLLSCAWSWARRGQNLAPATALALGLAVTGLLVFALATGQSAATPRAGEGLALALLASAAFVLMSNTARDLTRAGGPLLVAGSGLTLAGLGLLLAVLFLDPAAMALPSGQAWPVLSLVTYLVLGPTALAYVAYCSGLARCRSASAGLVASMVEPGLAAILGWAILGERLTPGQALGCALITVAMLVLWRAEHRAQPA